MRVTRNAAHLFGSLLGGAASLALLEPMARRVVAGNSDGATVILEGRTIASGNLLLSGWRLSLDSFWTIDALFNAVGAWVVGIDPVLIRAVPVVIAGAVIAVALAASTRGIAGRASLLAGVTVVALLALPSRPLALFFLQGPYHVGTTLYCLLGFALLSGGRFGWRWVAGVVVVAAAVVGDLQAVLLGIVPIAATGLLEARRSRRIRDGMPLVAAGGVAVVGSILAIAVERSAGGFQATKANTAASKGQMVRNLVHLPNEALSLLGVTTGPFGPVGVPMALRLAHLVVVAVVIVAIIRCGRRIVGDLRSIDRRRSTGAGRFDDLLAFGIVGDVIVFIALPITSSNAYARYLTAGMIFATILTARTVGRWSAGRRSKWRPALLVGAIAGVAIVSYGFALGGAAPPTPQSRLAAFLASANLTSGVGDYWSASITTVESHGKIAVRPVIAADGKVVRYEKQSQAAWYAGRPFDFYVYDASYIWNGDDRAVAVATFGRPAHTLAIGTYRVLVWPHPIVVGPIGSQGP